MISLFLLCRSDRFSTNVLSFLYKLRKKRQNNPQGLNSPDLKKTLTFDKDGHCGLRAGQHTFEQKLADNSNQPVFTGPVRQCPPLFCLRSFPWTTWGHHLPVHLCVHRHWPDPAILSDVFIDAETISRPGGQGHPDRYWRLVTHSISLQVRSESCQRTRRSGASRPEACTHL